MIKKGEIWVVELSSKGGREQEGRRPAVIIEDTSTSLALVIPLTANIKALTILPFTTLLSPSSINNLNHNSVALVSQLQAVDKIRLISKIGVLDNSYLVEINRILKKLLQI